MKIVCSELRVFVFENITKIYYYNYNVYICKYVVYVYKQCYVEMFNVLSLRVETVILHFFLNL